MEKQILYHETVPAYFMMAVFLAVAAWMGFNLYHQINYGPIGSKPAPNIVYIIGVAFPLLIGLNFSAIQIRVTNVDIRVSYGLISKTLAWKDVTTCEIDDRSTVRYGGWGIRLGFINGKPVTVYNTLGGTRVAFLTEGGKPRGLVVTTRHPEALMRVSRQLVEMQRS